MNQPGAHAKPQFCSLFMYGPRVRASGIALAAVAAAVFLGAGWVWNWLRLQFAETYFTANRLPQPSLHIQRTTELCLLCVLFSCCF